MNNIKGIQTIFKIPSWLSEQHNKRNSLPGRKVQSPQLGELSPHSNTAGRIPRYVPPLLKVNQVTSETPT